MRERIERLRELVTEAGLSGLLVTQPDNRRYLSGFPHRDPSIQSSAGWMLISSRGSYFITSPLYIDALAPFADGYEAVRYRRNPVEAVAELVAEWPEGRLGFESGWISYESHVTLRDALPDRLALEPTSGLVESLREIKSDDEVQRIQAAVDLTDRAFEHICSVLTPGMTESAIAWEIEKYMREHGAEGVAFETGVASGPNTAVPHHKPGDRQVGNGEPIWVDYGAMVDGYCADLTRSFCLGTADDRFRELFSVVLRSQELAKEGLRPGITGAEGDQLARAHLNDAGYGEQFTHGLGHGIGLAVHESPRVGPTGTAPLKAGMITSVEPGVYLPGWGGIRIEDLVLIDPGGARVLSAAPKPVVI